jgi:protein-disulfide isomerase
MRRKNFPAQDRSRSVNSTRIEPVPKTTRNHSCWKLFFLVLLTGLLSGLSFAQAKPSPDPVAQMDAWRTTVANNSSAPVQIIEFFDYQCPYCAKAIPELEEAIRSYPGKVQLILKNTPLAVHPDAMLAHQAALAAGEQGKYWEMYRLLYANPKNLQFDDLIGYSRELNLDTYSFRERLQSGYFKPAIQNDLALAKSMGVNATPTFFINKQKLVGIQTADRLKQAIALALRDPNAIFTPLDLPQTKVKLLDTSYAAVRGNKQAPVTVVEFSDFQCPYCASVAPTLRQLVAQYPGQVQWVFKNFPLDFHLDAPLAHRAALAAGEQGKFWEMHDLIFARQKAIKRDDLLDAARSLGLDMQKFQADMDGEKVRKMIESDKAEGVRLDVAGTPTFFVNGKEYTGGLSLTQLQTIIKKELPAGSTEPVIAKISGNEITVGDSNAPITLLWFSDLQSELTLKATLQVRQLMKAHPDKIRLVFRNRPLETHPGAIRLHEAALAANAQGRFWEMHDLIIANPHKDDEQTLLSYAVRLGLDVKKFQGELNAHKYRPVIDQDLSEASRLAVLGSPVFFVNTTRIDGLPAQAVLESAVSKQLASKMQASSH